MVWLFLLIVFTLLAAERVYQKGNSIPELPRKIVHIGGSVFAALLPFWFSYYQGIGVATAFFVLMVFTQYYKCLPSVHDVPRKTYGALLFPLGLMFSALFFWEKSPEIYVVSCLVLGFADGFAGFFSRYRVLVFTALSFWIFCGGLLWLDAPFVFWKILLGSAILALIEDKSSYGFDNITVPIFSGFIFQWIIFT